MKKTNKTYNFTKINISCYKTSNTKFTKNNTSSYKTNINLYFTKINNSCYKTSKTFIF